MRGCGGVRRKAESVETLIREMILPRLDANPRLLPFLAPEALKDEGTRPATAPALSVREAWENASQDSRRELVGVLIDSIVVLPQDTSRFDPSMILVRWRPRGASLANSKSESS
jgi:hypothetical protein